MTPPEAKVAPPKPVVTMTAADVQVGEFAFTIRQEGDRTVKPETWTLTAPVTGGTWNGLPDAKAAVDLAVRLAAPLTAYTEAKRVARETRVQWGEADRAAEEALAALKDFE